MTDKFKYPRTFHVPWTLGATSDDKIHDDKSIMRMFGGKRVVVTEKVDGENTTIYSDGTCHARSIDGRQHSSRSYVKSLAARVGCELPSGWRLLGENLYAQHSIQYDALPDYYICFGVVDENNVMQSWEDIEYYCDALGIKTTHVLYDGPFDVDKISSLYPFKSKFGKADAEGYVIRNAGSWKMTDFANNVAKFVRANHVQTGEHWMDVDVIPNSLSKH